MNLVGLKELADLLDVPYDTLKVWKNRDRLPEPFQVISGTPVWDWDISEEDFRSIEKNANSGRPKKPKISIAGGLIEIDVQGNQLSHQVLQFVPSLVLQSSTYSLEQVQQL